MRVRKTLFMLMTADMDRAVAFYRDALGLRATSSHWSELAWGDATIALHAGGDGTYTETGLGFEVEDLDEGCAAVLAHGGQVRRAPADRPGEPIRLADVVDPEGNGFSLSQPKA